MKIKNPFRPVVVISLLFIPYFLQAQDYPIHFGLMGGVNNCYMEGSEIDALEKQYKNTAEPLLTGNMGLRLAYNLKTWLEFESGAFFSGNGFELLLDSKSGVNWSGNMPRTVTANLYSIRKITFVEFPFSLRIQTPHFSKAKLRFYGFGGLRLGIVIKAIEKLVGETATSNFPNDGEKVDRKDLQTIDLLENRTLTDSAGRMLNYTYDDFYRRNDFSLSIGVGLEKRFTNVGLFFQGQYKYGLLNFNKLSDNARKEITNFGSDTSKSNVVFLGEPDAFFRSFQISVGFNVYFVKASREAKKYIQEENALINENES